MDLTILIWTSSLPGSAVFEGLLKKSRHQKQFLPESYPVELLGKIFLVTEHKVQSFIENEEAAKIVI